VWRRRRNDEEEKRLPLRKQAVLQAVCVFIAFTVIFPIMWVVSLALDPRGLPRPDGLNLIPPGASLDSFVQVIQQPTSNPIDFLGLFKNSFILAADTDVDLLDRRRCQRRLCLLAAAVPRPAGADARNPRCADAAAGRHDRAALCPVQPDPL
jgi:hypothetical protein